MISGTDSLAVHGGPPVRQTILPYGRQWVDEDDIAAVVDVLRSDWLTTGPKVGEFEEAFAARVDARYAVSFSSGTAALHGAAFAAGLGPGDEAVTTPMTFCATANCVVYQGARPIFADVQPETLNIDPEQVRQRLTSSTRAILPVDFAGHPVDLDPLLELAEAQGLVVIEDASHALGATYRGRRVGSISHMTVFSFHPVKHITTGEGGMVTTNDPELAGRLRRFRNHGIDRDAAQRQREGHWYYEMVELGYNYRVSDLQCALGLAQLTKLPAWLLRRQEIAQRYDAVFADMPAILPLGVRPDVSHAYHLYVIRVDQQLLRADRAEVFAALRAEGIGVNVHYLPVHLHEFYRRRFGTGAGSHPIAEAAYASIISLPIFARMSNGDVEDVVAAVSKVVGAYARQETG